MNKSSAVRLPVFDFDLRNPAANSLAVVPILRITVPAPQSQAPVAPLVTLRRLDLIADLRRARAERFTDRYEWLALRRRRAQIAARCALGRLD